MVAFFDKLKKFFFFFHCLILSNSYWYFIDASADNYKKYKCKKRTPRGMYNTPREELNETWPICQPKTTTVKPRKNNSNLN